MNDKAKALIKRTALSVLIMVLVLLLFRALVLWVLVAVLLWWAWKAVSE